MKKTERRRETTWQCFVNTLEECSLMLVHNWTTAPPPPSHQPPLPHTETLPSVVNISNTVIRTGYRAARRYSSQQECASRCCDLRWDRLTETLGEGRKGFEGSYIAWNKPSTSVHECTFVQDSLSSVQWREKTQLSSKHQRIPVMMKRHNISLNSIPHCLIDKLKKKKSAKKTKKTQNKTSKSIILYQSLSFILKIKKDVLTNKIL